MTLFAALAMIGAYVVVVNSKGKEEAFGDKPTIKTEAELLQEAKEQMELQLLQVPENQTEYIDYLVKIEQAIRIYLDRGGKMDFWF